jgi:hypothetical protein
MTALLPLLLFAALVTMLPAREETDEEYQERLWTM